MKKIMFWVMCSALLLSACGNAETKPSETESTVISSENVLSETESESDDLWEKMNEAEEKIKAFLQSDEYKNAEKDKKAEMALKFVEELQKDGLIQHYDYFEDNELISYSHLNGVLGGISFHDFNEKTDGLAMN